jgi:hypothetical protein
MSLELPLLALAAFVAGAVNALAGGGSLISFPALIAAGHSPLAANVTNAVALWPGYLGSVLGFRPELVGQGPRLRGFVVDAVVGAVAGSVLLLALPDEAFDLVVPALVLLATGLLALQPRLSRRLRERGPGAARGHRLALHASIVAGATYGAYFGGGLGVVLLAVLGLFVADSLTRLNATKSVLALLINTVALVAFALFGPVDWLAAAVMAPASITGGLSGARLARLLPPDRLRVSVVVVGTGVGIALLVG